MGVREGVSNASDAHADENDLDSRNTESGFDLQHPSEFKDIDNVIDQDKGSKPLLAEELYAIKEPSEGGNGSVTPPRHLGHQGIDAVYAELGNPGKFLVIQFLLNFLCCFSISFPVLMYVFIGYTPPHQCARLENETLLLENHSLENDSSARVQYDQCNIRLVSNSTGELTTVAEMNCLNGFDFNGLEHMSFTSEWNLVCEHRTWMSELVQSTMMIGQTVGALTMPPLADRFGRKPLFTGCNALLIAVGLGVAYAPNLYVLLVLRFATGIFQQGTGLVGWTLLLEHLRPRYRRFAAVCGGMNWTATVCTLGVVAWLLRDFSWRALSLVASLTGVNFILYIFFLTESPRWLANNKKYDECLNIIKIACRQNGKDYERVKEAFNLYVVSQSRIDEMKREKLEQKDNGEGLLDLLKNKKLFIATLFLCFVWVTNSITYYGLFLVSSSLAGNRYFNFLLMAIVDFPGELANYLLMDRVGRRRTIMILLIVTGSALLAASVLLAVSTNDIMSTLGTVCSFIGKCGIGPCFTAIFTYTPELFPTNIRSTGLGLCSSISRIGGMVAPYSKSLADIVLWGPGAIFSGMCFLSAVLIALLPETMGRVLPNTIQELKDFASQGKTKKRKTDFEITVDKAE